MSNSSNYRKSLLLASLAMLCLCLPFAASAGQSAKAVETTAATQWQVFELTLEAQNPPSDKWAPAVRVRFEGPNGERLIIGGFWDGGKTWKLRFTPTAPGTWHFATRSKDPALHGITGTLQVKPAAGATPLARHGGFLRVSANRHYLTYTDGTPFFWLGDTWWFCPSKLMPFDSSNHPGIASMYKELVNTREQQGYTVLHWAFEGPTLGAVSKPFIFDFVKAGTLPPPDYWRQVDQYVEYANQHGLIPYIAVGFSDQLDKVSLEQLEKLWRYLVDRLGAYSVGWLICGEYNDRYLGSVVEQRVQKVLALGQFIKDLDPYKRAMSVHPWAYSWDKREAWKASWYDFIMFQGAHGSPPDYEVYLDTYFKGPDKPFVEGECDYEGIRGMTDKEVRRAAWRALQSGACGYTYGAQGLWYPTQGPDDKKFAEWGGIIPWWVAYKKPGAREMGYMRRFYESLDWWKLAPLPKALLESGKFEKLQRPAVLGKDDLLVVYFPPDLAPDAPVKLVAPVKRISYRARWFDPRSGEFKAESPLEASAEGVLALPQRPDDEDWSLLLEKAAAPARSGS